jgi:hypothetical protein
MPTTPNIGYCRREPQRRAEGTHLKKARRNLRAAIRLFKPLKIVVKGEIPLVMPLHRSKG